MALGTRFDSILVASQAGADWALGALYLEFQPRLLRYFLAQAPAEAEDLAADVWINAANSLRRFEGDESALGRWLFTIAHRRLVDFRRRSARRRDVQLSLETLSGNTSSTAWLTEPAGEALALLATLPSAYAEIVFLRVVGGYESAEVAEIVGRKPGTVRVMQKRALERLAEHLTESSTAAVTQ
jgi:RNA polymerase sigma-70 factor (ECF subfamily)